LYRPISASPDRRPITVRLGQNASPILFCLEAAALGGLALGAAAFLRRRSEHFNA
jgi:MYXO-CTERM domain-containing protein